MLAACGLADYTAALLPSSTVLLCFARIAYATVGLLRFGMQAVGVGIVCPDVLRQTTESQGCGSTCRDAPVRCAMTQPYPPRRP